MLLRPSLTRALPRTTTTNAHFALLRASLLPKTTTQFQTRSFPPPTLHTHRRSYSTPMATSPSTTVPAEASSESGVTASSLTQTLKSKLDPSAHVEIEDMSGGCGQAFNALIVSSQFEKKTLLARHRLVNGALREEIKAIHAWTPRCITPEQWEKEKAG